MFRMVSITSDPRPLIASPSRLTGYPCPSGEGKNFELGHTIFRYTNWLTVCWLTCVLGMWLTWQGLSQIKGKEGRDPAPPLGYATWFGQRRMLVGTLAMRTIVPRTAPAVR
jgi:hypothetical protein